MRKTHRTLATTAAILPALLLVAGGARADSDSDSDSYGGYYAHHKVKKLAYEVAGRARDAHRAAERYTYRPTYRQEHALRLLHDLEECAEHFAYQVKRYDEPYKTHRDFEALKRAYYRASSAAHYVQANRHVERDFDYLAESMYALTSYYEEYAYPRRAKRRYPRYRDRGRVRIGGHDFHLDFGWPWR